MEALKLGTVESLIIALRDRLENVTDLNTVTNLRFDVRRKNDDQSILTDVAAAIDTGNPMRAICEIDTTQSGFTSTEDIEYKLYLKYDSGSESPVLGPTNFRVVTD